MKKLIFLALIFPLWINAVTINFENLTSGTLVTNQYQSQGVIFSSNYYYPVHDGKIGDVRIPDYGVYDFGGAGPMSLCYGGVGSILGIKFVLANGTNAITNSVQFRIGDGDSASETFRVSFFDVNNILLSQNTYTTYSGSVNGGVTLSFTNPNIHRIEIAGTGSGSGGSIDDLIFNTTQAIPEPGTCLLLLIGLAVYLKSLSKR